MASGFSIVTGVAAPNAKRGGCTLQLSNHEALFLASLLFAAKVASGSNWEDLTEPVRQQLLVCYPGFTDAEAATVATLTGTAGFDRGALGYFADAYAAGSR